jgi:mannitol PTS system EIICBA or EIICB component
MRKFAQLLSAMVYQNIAVIIAAGIIRELFGVYSWLYNDRILLLVNPIYSTLLPVLIGYTGGKILGGQRGGVVASISTYGLTLASSTPAILGAMIVGPLTGWLVGKVDQTVKKKMPVAGYELLIGNVFAAFIAVILTIISFLYVGQTFSAGVKWALSYLEIVIHAGWLPLTSILIEPAKVLFFNNFINYGVLGPIGIQQAKELGKSIFFLLEANPGPGLGVLLAYWLKTKAEQKKGAKLAIFIHFFGGIHEVYFPYVLLRPLLLIPLILGGMAGVYTFQQFNVGLVSMASPGSIFLFIGLGPKQDMLFIVIGFLISALVSFLGSMLILKKHTLSPTAAETRNNINNFYLFQKNESPKSDEIYTAVESEEELNVQANRSVFNKIKNIVFVCEAGLGSSAMGAAMLKKKLEKENLEIEVDNSSLREVPDSADLIICNKKLYTEVRKVAPGKACYPLQSFTDIKEYEELIDKLRGL